MRRAVEGAAQLWVDRRLTFPLAFAMGGGAAGLSMATGAPLGDLASVMLPAATFLAAAMVNVLLRVWSWGEANDAAVARLTGHETRERVARENLRARFNALERVQTVSAVATTASVLLILMLIVAVLNPASVVGGETVIPAANLWATHASVGLSTAIAVFLLGIVADTVNVGVASLGRSRATVGSQSGPHG